MYEHRRKEQSPSLSRTSTTGACSDLQETPDNSTTIPVVCVPHRSPLAFPSFLHRWTEAAVVNSFGPYLSSCAQVPLSLKSIFDAGEQHAALTTGSIRTMQ